MNARVMLVMVELVLIWDNKWFYFLVEFDESQVKTFKLMKAKQWLYLKFIQSCQGTNKQEANWHSIHNNIDVYNYNNQSTTFKRK